MDMTKFEKIAKRAELLEYAYKAIIDRDNWDNMVYESDFSDTIEGREEWHEFYISVAKEIEKLL